MRFVLVKSQIVQQACNYREEFIELLLFCYLGYDNNTSLIQENNMGTGDDLILNSAIVADFIGWDIVNGKAEGFIHQHFLFLYLWAKKPSVGRNRNLKGYFGFYFSRLQDDGWNILTGGKRLQKPIGFFGRLGGKRPAFGSMDRYTRRRQLELGYGFGLNGFFFLKLVG